MTHLVPVAVVGAGNMGGGMLTRLLGLGWSVAVHDIDPQVQAQAVALGRSLVGLPWRRPESWRPMVC
jgi:3-hydroxyisobutyrate dehydrogenase